MKTLFIFSTSICLLCSEVSAQETNRFSVPIRWGIKMGLNISNFTGEATLLPATDISNGYYKPFEAKSGFHIGAIAIADLQQYWSHAFIKSGILLSRKGGQVNKVYNCSPYYIEIPLHLGGQYKLGTEWTFLFDVGPYFAYGIGGKTRRDYGVYNEDKQHLAADDNPQSSFFDTIKRFDSGCGVEIGFLFQKQHYLDLGYDLGMETLKEKLGKNCNFVLSYTYLFR